MIIKFSTEAELEFRESINFYNKRKKGLGKTFSNEIKKKILFISKNPLSSANKYSNIRVTVLAKFPFTIHYKMSEDLLLIVAIFHSSRSPENLER